uniref:Uncharacterized protein n=1 Tax=Candidozyma auris TaxID=498019 RepID=A0A0L0P4C6_CANAR
MLAEGLKKKNVKAWQFCRLWTCNGKCGEAFSFPVSTVFSSASTLPALQDTGCPERRACQQFPPVLRAQAESVEEKDRCKKGESNLVTQL